MDNNYTHILFILDDSGSMRSVLDDAIGGFNSFLEEQKELDGKCKMHTMLFGSAGNFTYIHKDENINDIEDITIEEYNANSGMTALIDAIAKGIIDLGDFLRAMNEDERPEKVLVNIFTDGAENDSVEFNESELREMIDEQTDEYNWEFAFLASDINSVNFAQRSGFKNIAKTDKTSGGIRSMYASVNENAKSYRSRGMTVDVQTEYDNAQNKDSEDSEEG